MPLPAKVTITDPRVMRALAHPARLAVMEHLSSTGASITATECAEVVGLSPSATSYHLRALARFGLVEQAPGRGDARERLWRSTLQSWGYEAGRQADAEARDAGQTLFEVFLARETDRARQWLREAAQEPAPWYDAAMFSTSMLLLTAEELHGLNEALLTLMEPFRRRARQAEPPEGARLVAVSYKAIPVQDPAAATRPAPEG